MALTNLSNSILFTVTMIVMSAFGTAMIAVGVWAMVAPYSITLPLNYISLKSSEFAGASAKVAISAGVFTILLAFGSLHDFKDVNKKIQLVVVAIGMLVITALSIAAMSVAVDEINSVEGAKELLGIFGLTIDMEVEERLVIERRKIVAIISGISASAQIFGLIVTAKELSSLKSQQQEIHNTEPSKY